MSLCYLGLGSNLRMPPRQLIRALRQLRQLPRSYLAKQSGIYLSKPLGLKAQPNYLNMVVALRTNLPPLEVLRRCQLIEKKQQRIRKKHWGARTIDIDLLLYGRRTIKRPHLRIPHPNLHCRDFVLHPLMEIAPNVSLPNGQALVDFVCVNKYYLKNHYGIKHSAHNPVRPINNIDMTTNF